MQFKNRVLESKDILNLKNEVYKYNCEIQKHEYFKTIEENILLIYGYTQRLDDINQRLFYTFSEAINAINLDVMMKNDESLKLNLYVYTTVLKEIISEHENEDFDVEFKQKALAYYKDFEEKKSKENSKYHIYQY